MAPSTGKVYQFTLSPSKWGHSGVRPYEPKDDASANEADDGDEVRELGKDNQGSTKENEDAGRSKQTPALATREPRTRGDHSVTGYCLHVQKRFLIDQPKLAGKGVPVLDSQEGQSSFELRDVVLAKVRGFPRWPGMIVDPDSAPENVLRERPFYKTMWYCVRFFPAGDYAWLVAKDISKLQKHEIEAYIGEPHKKPGDLLAGYQIALDPTQWEEELQAATLEAEESANAEVNALVSKDGDEVRKSIESGKKRKCKPDEAESQATKGSESGKKKSSGVKAMVGFEVGENADAEDDGARRTKKTSPPPAKKSKRDNVDPATLEDPGVRKVRKWRNKLQKRFLSSEHQPGDEDMPAADVLFTTIEQYDKTNVACLQFPKIVGTMRRIATLPPEKVPRDSEFNFTARANALVTRWGRILEAKKLNMGVTVNQASATATRGEAKEIQEVDGDLDLNADQSTLNQNDEGRDRADLDPDTTIDSTMHVDQCDPEGEAGDTSNRETVPPLDKSEHVKAAIEGTDAAQACGSWTGEVDESMCQVHPHDGDGQGAATPAELARDHGAESGEHAYLGASNRLPSPALEGQSLRLVDVTPSVTEKNIELEIARHAAKRAKHESAKVRAVAKALARAQVERERMRQRTRRLEMKYERERDKELHQLLQMQLDDHVAEPE